MVISANFFRLSHLASNEAFLNFFADSQLSLLGIIFFHVIDIDINDHINDFNLFIRW